MVIRGSTDSLPEFDTSAPLTQVLNLGMIAQQLGCTLEFDREANDMLTMKPRKGWEEYV